MRVGGRAVSSLSRCARLAGAAALMGAAALLVSVAWSSVGPVETASADPIAACTATTGVIVVVDFSHWGGDVERGCDATVATGYDALHAAGFTTAGDEADGPAFICRIDNEPSPAEDPCEVTPPATAYWSYWHADAGQDTWSLSELGAMSYHPLPGSVDAWTFGGTYVGGTQGQPSVPPSAVRATNPGPPTTVATVPPSTSSTSSTTTSTVAPTPPAPTPGTTAAPPTSSSVGTAPVVSDTRPKGAAVSGSGKTGDAVRGSTGLAPRGSSAKASPAATTATTAPSGSSSAGAARQALVSGEATLPVGGRSVPKIVDVGPVAAGENKAPSNAGSLVRTLIAVSVVAVLAAGGGLTAWRRRRTG
jgi:hypothetical protein